MQASARVLLLASLSPLPACFELPSVDLEGPQVVSSSLNSPRSVEIPVRPTIEIELSEPLDPASVHAGSVALFAWEPVGDCSLTPICEKGSCERGQCMEDPVRSSDRNALDRGELEPGIALELELVAGPAGPASVLKVQPQRPLAEHTRHTLIVGAAVRDRGGASLVDEWGQVHGFSRDFVTAALGSSGPEPSLLAPLPGELALPTNLAHVELRVYPPIPWPQPDAKIWLEDELGEGVWLIDPEPCVDWLLGTCVRMRPQTLLAADRRYRPAGGSLVDRLDRPALPSAAERETWFATGSGLDQDPPQVELHAELRTRCLVVWVASEELLGARLIVDDRAREQILAPGVAALGVPVGGEHLPGESIAWTLELRDRADNSSSSSGELVAGASFDPSLPRLVFTEVLGNPLGPEPDAEFIELLALEPSDTSELRLSDHTPSELFASWARGDDPSGDLLPSLELEPDQLALIVGSGWAPGLGGDPSPPPQTPLLVVDSSLASGGIKNAGEPLTLWRASPQGPLIVASYANWIDTSAKAHGGRSVVAEPDGCDLPDRWRSQPLATSSPGAL